jgi:hypothetical protein
MKLQHFLAIVVVLIFQPGNLSPADAATLAAVPTGTGLKVFAVAALLAIAVDRLRAGRNRA